LPPGLYTVVLGEEGHRTVLVREADAEFRRGVLVLAYLAGPDNDRDYVGFAHVTTAGDLHVWRRFRADSRLVEAVKLLAGDPTAAARAYGLRSGRCFACGHTLTRPDSIARGYGPVCGTGLSVVERGKAGTGRSD
jgi:hypothetical protein